MPKSPAYSRLEFRRALRTWLRINRRIFLVAAVFIVVFAGVGTALLLWLHGDRHSIWYVLGGLHGLLVAALAASIVLGLLVHDPEAIWHLRGAWGEENTRDELASARRRGVIWGWVDSIALGGGDLDHFVVTKRGGVLVVDSKWRSSVDADDAARIAASTTKVRQRAQALAMQLLGTDRARHRSRGAAVKVVPVVVLWGRGQRRLAQGHVHHQGVDFVAGRHLKAWLRTLDSEPVSEAAAKDLIERLTRFRDEVSRNAAGANTPS